MTSARKQDERLRAMANMATQKGRIHHLPTASSPPSHFTSFLRGKRLSGSPARPVCSREDMVMNQWPAQAQCKVYFGIVRLISMVLRIASLPDGRALGLIKTTTQLVMKCTSLP